MTAAVADSTSSCGSSPDTGKPGCVAVQVPAGSFMRSMSGRHELLVTGGQDSAQSHPPALAAATTGVRSDCADQLAPSLPVTHNLPRSVTTHVPAPATAATCSNSVYCGAAVNLSAPRRP